MGIKITGYNITTDPTYLDDQNAITPELSRLLERYHHMALEGKRSSIPKMLRAIEKYPKNPQLKNYLSVLYNRLEEDQKMYDVNKWILAEHPNYLFGKLNLANEYYLKQDYDKMAEVLGHEMELKNLYPERDTFHLMEVTAFFKSTILYYIGIGDMEQAELRYDLMQQVAPESPDTEMVMHHIMTARMKIVKERHEEEQKNKILVKTNPQKITKNSEPPVFRHKEINALYEYGLFIEKDKIETILSLPRETLVQDLELVLKDSIDRFAFFQNRVEEEGLSDEKTNFVIHAFFILGELEVSQSLEVIFQVLSQSGEYLELYFGDFLSEAIWEPLVKIGSDRLQECKKFLCEPGNDTYARNVVLDMAMQIVLHHPDRKPEVLNWFEEVIQFFLASKIDDNVIDSDLIAFLICNLINIEGGELLPSIEKLFEKGIVSTGICGSRKDVNDAFARSDDFDNRRDMLSIFDRYDLITSTWGGYNESNWIPEIDLSEQMDTFLKPIIKEGKIGRNEKCPCGSGKKYKKCCIN